MTELQPSDSIRNRPLAAFLALMTWLAWSTSAGALDLNIQSEADYQDMLDGIRAAEYTRQNYLEGDQNPRAIVAVAGLWAFAERNPQATAEQLYAFTLAFDSALAMQIAGDADLTSFGSVLSAIGGASVASDGLLTGMDTRIGTRLIELLGLSLPGLFNFEQAQQRMSQFDLASVQRLIQRRETMDALTSVLAGVTPEGQRPDRLGRVAAAYLTAQGLAPQLGSVDDDETEINAGLEHLPTYAEFIAIRDTPGQHLALEQANFDDIDQIQSEGESLLQGIGNPQADLGQFLDALSLSLAASDPSDPDHAAAVAEFEARRQAIVDSSRATAAQRAAVFARTLLLQQSSFEDVRAVATNTRSFAALQLQTNNSLAIAEQASGIAGSLVGVFAGVKTGDPWGAVQSMTDVVTGAFGLASLFGPTGPSAEEQIFDQIVELRQQVEDMRVQLNGRFDIVDEKLNVLFSTMSSSFASIGSQIGDLQSDLDAVAFAIAEQRSALDRIEDALFGFANEIFLAELSERFNGVLNYFDNNGTSLPYSGPISSFVDGTNFFFTFATTNAKNSSFAGTPEGASLAVTLDNAASTLNDGDTAIARYINDLRRLPAQLFTSGGDPVGALSTTRIAAPSPWAQAAAAYLQLARENPWYFNYQFGIQSSSPGSTRIDDIIDEGQRIVNFADTVRSEPDLFDALLTRASEGVTLLQNEIERLMDSWFEQEIGPGFSGGGARIDAWGALGQPVSPFLQRVSQLNVFWPAGGNAVLGNLPVSPQKGMEIPVGDRRFGFPAGTTRVEVAERNALSHLLQHGPIEPPRINMWLNKRSLDVLPRHELTLTFGLAVPSAAGARRVIDFILETNCFANCSGIPPGWRPLNFRPQGAGAPLIYFDFFDAGVGTLVSEFRTDLVNGDLEGEIYSSVTVSDGSAGYSLRFRVLEDRTFAEQGGNPMFADQALFLTNELHAARVALREEFIVEMSTPGSLVDQAGLRLANDAALLDAYLTVGMADALTQSELLRSAFRGIGSIAGL
jgi:hypothetical protein